MTSSKGGIYGGQGGQPVDITVHVRKEGDSGVAGGGRPAGDMQALSGGQRTPPRQASAATGGKKDDWSGPANRGIGGRWSGAELRGVKTDPAQEVREVQKQRRQMGETMLLLKKFLPFLSVVGLIHMAISKSAAMSAMIDLIGSFLGIMLDVILMPLLMPVLEALGPLIPGLVSLVDTLMKFIGGVIFVDLVNIIVGALNLIVSGIEALQDIWGTLFGKEETYQGGESMAGLSEAGKKYVREHPEETGYKPASKGWASQIPGYDQANWIGRNFSLSGMTNAVSDVVNSMTKMFGGAQGGMAFVPKTMPLVVHRGERILNAEEATRYNASPTGQFLFHNEFHIQANGQIEADMIGYRAAEMAMAKFKSDMRRAG